MSVLGAGAPKTEALHFTLALCRGALSPNESSGGGWKEASAFISVLHVKRESWKFLLSASLRSVPWIPA